MEHDDHSCPEQSPLAQAALALVVTSLIAVSLTACEGEERNEAENRQISTGLKNLANAATKRSCITNVELAGLNQINGVLGTLRCKIPPLSSLTPLISRVSKSSLASYWNMSQEWASEAVSSYAQQ